MAAAGTATSARAGCRSGAGADAASTDAVDGSLPPVAAAARRHDTCPRWFRMRCEALGAGLRSQRVLSPVGGASAGQRQAAALAAECLQHRHACSC